MRYPLKELWFKSGVVIVKYKTKWKSYLKKKSNKKTFNWFKFKSKKQITNKQKINKNQLFILTQITYHLSFTKEDILPAFKIFELFFFQALDLHASLHNIFFVIL